MADTPLAAAQSRRFAPITAAEVLQQPPTRWTVKGVLPEKGLAAVYGASGSGKSFLTLDMAAAIGEGRNWFGHRTRLTPILYLFLEGQAGLAKRIQAWELVHGRKFPTTVEFMTDSAFMLTDATAIHALAEWPTPGSLIVIDTLTQSAPLVDENASAGMGEILEGAKLLQRLTGGMVLFVHHAGKDVARGMRGHSSLYAALDAVIEVQRNGDSRSWTIAKSKDGEDGGGQAFKLNGVALGIDADGDPITSCAIEVDQNPPLADSKTRKLGAVEGAVLEYLRAKGTGVRLAELAKHFDGQYARGSVYRSVEKLHDQLLVHKAANTGMVCIAEAMR